MSQKIDKIIQGLSHQELIDLQEKINTLSRIRTYAVQFDIDFKSTRTDDLSEPDTFESNFIDAIHDVFDLISPEQIHNISVIEK